RVAALHGHELAAGVGGRRREQAAACGHGRPGHSEPYQESPAIEVHFARRDVPEAQNGGFLDQHVFYLEALARQAVASSSPSYVAFAALDARRDGRFPPSPRISRPGLAFFATPPTNRLPFSRFVLLFQLVHSSPEWKRPQRKNHR